MSRIVIVIINIPSSQTYRYYLHKCMLSESRGNGDKTDVSKISRNIEESETKQTCMKKSYVMVGKNRNSVPVNIQFGKRPIAIYQTPSTQME
jgi:hypothetical protein